MQLNAIEITDPLLTREQVWDMLSKLELPSISSIADVRTIDYAEHSFVLYVQANEVDRIQKLFPNTMVDTNPQDFGDIYRAQNPMLHTSEDYEYFKTKFTPDNDCITTYHQIRKVFIKHLSNADIISMSFKIGAYDARAGNVYGLRPI